MYISIKMVGKSKKTGEPMKTPLQYQMSEYDCGPTTLDNAIRFLFEREEIPPDIIRNITLYCLDCHGDGGVPGKRGTSRSAMMFLANWLDDYGRFSSLHVSSRYISGREVNMSSNGLILDALRRGGAVVVRLWFEVEHYALLTGITSDGVMMFDPYYETVPDIGDAPDIRIVKDAPFTHNRIVPLHYFESETESLYSLGPEADREAMLLFNSDTKLTADKTIEYFI